MSSSQTAIPPFQIMIQPSGRTFTTDAGETILAAAIRQGIGMPYGCKDGACGSCKCKKLEGSVVHGAHQAKAGQGRDGDGGASLGGEGQQQGRNGQLGRQAETGGRYRGGLERMGPGGFAHT